MRSGHSNKNLGRCVECIAPRRPKGCVCAGKRGHSWKNHCGCVNSSALMKWIKSVNMKLLIKAGERKDPDCYRNWLDALSDCIFENKHENCAHHDDVDYQTPLQRRVTCPWHR